MSISNKSITPSPQIPFINQFINKSSDAITKIKPPKNFIDLSLLFAPFYFYQSSTLSTFIIKAFLSPAALALSYTIASEANKNLHNSSFYNHSTAATKKVTRVCLSILPFVVSTLATDYLTEKSSSHLSLGHVLFAAPLIHLTSEVIKSLSAANKPKYVTLSPNEPFRNNYLVKAKEALAVWKADLTRTDLIDCLLNPGGLIEHYGMSLILNTSTNVPSFSYQEKHFCYRLKNVGPKELEDEIRNDLSGINITLPERLYS